MADRYCYPFRMLESTLGIGFLLPQTGVYVPRRLYQASGLVTGALTIFNGGGYRVWSPGAW